MQEAIAPAVLEILWKTSAVRFQVKNYKDKKVHRIWKSLMKLKECKALDILLTAITNHLITKILSLPLLNEKFKVLKYKLKKC